MKYGKSYLRDRRKLLLALCVLAGAAAVLFWLYGLPFEPLLYTGLVCATLGLCLALPDFLSYVRRAKTLEALESSLPVTLEFPELSGSLQERLLGGIAATLCEMVRERETSSAAKRQDMLEYYTLWVHQIKTPLSAMRLILQSSGEMPEREALLQELFKVERYVEMVLGYLRLDTMSSDLRLESCTVHGIVKQAVKKFAPQFIYQKLSVELRDFDNRVITDEKWLLFVLEQLLSNALKYTREGGVLISMDQNDILTIRDTGVGISPEDLPRVFERGFTGQNGRSALTGSPERASTGLGLYLTKQVLSKLQNRIEIDSAPGEGTEVRLYLHRGKWNAY